MTNVYDELKERGFIDNCSNEEGLRGQLEEPTTCYIGFDPTASSYHIGNLIPIMALAHMQRHGHRPIVIVGGGTGMVGDPSGKDEARRVMTVDEIQANLESQKKVMRKYLDFGANKATMINNADWLTKLNYIEFLRDIGVHFSVNRMLAAEAYKARLERGLSFLEFNYQLLQAYDYLTLYRDYDCRLQMGGSDQWGNILAGVDLVRRVEQEEVYALVFPLITTASGAKMGKTAEGAVWLDAARVSPYDFYQYWINVEDADVERFLALYTFLPMEKVRELGKLEGAEIRRAKEVLAYEATKITHGEDEARKAQEAARALFSGDASAANVPTVTLSHAELEAGIQAVDLFVRAGLRNSKSEARRLIKQGGAYVNDVTVASYDELIDAARLVSGEIMLRAGKKKYMRVVAES